ncbi:hypothetical protein QA640_38865 [Bradyrhizobium sp. CB82]|uniref:hypothetical protein n=1 Tax=Bradyrhizobium sp. CB82 TaxID=3039159 RepID=UPI0024B1B106|nr:hypothetical protein [Bradyrhizobium sp. CB82]WFU40117.1 hypothetical protein QA640_38865 [Bradyrhizobium sp. CB82]
MAAPSLFAATIWEVVTDIMRYDCENTIGEIDFLDEMHLHRGSVTIRFRKLDLNLPIAVDALMTERSFTAAVLMADER